MNMPTNQLPNDGSDADTATVTELLYEETAADPSDPSHGNGVDRQATLEMRELKALLEALLFVSPEPVSVDRLVTVLGEVTKAEVGEALGLLREDFDREGHGLQVVEIAGGFQLRTRPDYGPWIKRLERAKASPKLSRSALETLSIIAYKQPIVRSEIEQIRGVETSGVLRTLLERKLVRLVGRKDVPGRPILYGTTKYFLQHFGLRELSELPPLREFKELGEPDQPFLPVGDDDVAVGTEGITAQEAPEAEVWSASGDPVAQRGPLESA